MYWIEEVNANHMDTVLIPHIIEAHAQKRENGNKAEATCANGKPKSM